jgi:hypothetical protein
MRTRIFTKPNKINCRHLYKKKKKQSPEDSRHVLGLVETEYTAIGVATRSALITHNTLHEIGLINAKDEFIIRISRQYSM